MIIQVIQLDYRTGHVLLEPSYQAPHTLARCSPKHVIGVAARGQKLLGYRCSTEVHYHPLSCLEDRVTIRTPTSAGKTSTTRVVS